ncbi:MAG: hypothetical protein ACXWP4_22025 [Polyangiales bacterium]
MLTLAASRRVHALRDPSTLSVGGGYGEHDAHLTCGPDVRVRDASGGAHYHQVIGENGTGFVVDARAGYGRSSTSVYPDTTHQPTGSTSPPDAPGRNLGAAQLALGYAWERSGFFVGGGYYGALQGAYADSAGTRRSFLPAAEVRFGLGRPFTGKVGLGSPPIPTLARFYSLYADFEFRKDTHGFGFGVYAPLQSELEQRSGFYGRAWVLAFDPVRIGAFAGPQINNVSADRRIGFVLGADLEVVLSE